AFPALDRTYGFSRWPAPWAFARMPPTAPASTSQSSSTSGATVVTAKAGGAATLAARSAAGFLPRSATTAVKTSPLVTRWRETGESVGVDPAGAPSVRPQFRQLTASARFMDAHDGHGIEFGMDHLRTDDRYDLEPPLVEHEGGEPRLVVRTAHLLDPNPPLDLDVRDRVHLELDDPVREERLVPPRLGSFESEVRRLRCGFGEHQGRRAEIPQPLEQPEQLRPAVLELREDLERLERVDDDEVDAIDIFFRRHRAPKEFHPRLRRALPDLFLNRADIEDVHVRADRLHVEPHRGHLGLEADSEHLGQRERPDAVDRVALIVAHRAHPAVRAQVPDLRVDRALGGGEGRVRRREEPALIDRFCVRFARFLRVLGRLEFRE